MNGLGPNTKPQMLGDNARFETVALREVHRPAANMAEA
jgi:hypothetical protein